MMYRSVRFGRVILTGPPGRQIHLALLTKRDHHARVLLALTNRRDEDGASAVEYGLLVAAIAAVVVTLVFALGGMIKGSFQKHLRRRQDRHRLDRDLRLTARCSDNPPGST